MTSPSKKQMTSTSKKSTDLVVLKKSTNLVVPPLVNVGMDDDEKILIPLDTRSVLYQQDRFNRIVVQYNVLISPDYLAALNKQKEILNTAILTSNIVIPVAGGGFALVSIGAGTTMLGLSAASGVGSLGALVAGGFYLTSGLGYGALALGNLGIMGLAGLAGLGWGAAVIVVGGIGAGLGIAAGVAGIVAGALAGFCVFPAAGIVGIVGLGLGAGAAVVLGGAAVMTLGFVPVGGIFLGAMVAGTFFSAGALLAGAAGLGFVGLGAVLGLNAIGLGALGVGSITVGTVAGFTTGALTAIVNTIGDPILQAIARDYVKKIDQQGGGQVFFGNLLDDGYQSFINDPKTIQYLASLQEFYDADSLVGITALGLPEDARKLAAITKNADKSLDNKAYINRFVSGQIRADETISIDPTAGVTNLGDGKGVGTTQLITFLSPLMAPGEVKKQTVKTAKNEYQTTLNVISTSGRWTFNDGVSNSIIDMTNTVSKLKSYDKSEKKVIFTINAGGGNDQLIASAAQTDYDGGTGTNSVSYHQLNETSNIEVIATANGFTVNKKATNANMYEEVIRSENVTHGKTSAQVQYRDITAVTGAINETDHLYNVQNIGGSQGNDTIRGNESDNVITGNGGNDYLEGNGGNDTFIQDFRDLFDDSGDQKVRNGIYANRDTIDGGNGNNTVVYVLPEDKGLPGGISADLNIGTIYTFKLKDSGEYSDDGFIHSYDTVRNIQNIYGSTLNDAMVGNYQDNILDGNDGMDTISGGMGDDTLSGGRGDDVLNGNVGDDYIKGGLGADIIRGGLGNDRIIQELDASWAPRPDVIDGGDGIDTLDYSTTSNMIVDGDFNGALTAGAQTEYTVAGPQFSSNEYYQAFREQQRGGVVSLNKDVSEIGNLLLNGHFATGGGYWRNSRDNKAEFEHEFFAGRGSDGTSGANFNTQGGAKGGYILQTIDTVAGQTYTFQVDAHGWGTGGDSSVTLAAINGEELGAYLAGSKEFTCGADQKATNNLNKGETFTITFTAASARTTLLIHDTSPTVSNDEDLVVDNAIVHRKDADYFGVNGDRDSFLFVQGAQETSGLQFWKQNTNLVAGATYRFSYMVNGGISSDPASIQLVVDGVAQGTSKQVSPSEGWQLVEVEFTAARNGYAQIGLRDTNPANKGNRFMLDKLSLLQVTGKGIVADLSSVTNGQTQVQKFNNLTAGNFTAFSAPIPLPKSNNLVKNGSFTGDYANHWEVTGNVRFYDFDHNLRGRGSDGTPGVVFNSGRSAAANGVIKQTIATEIGRTYIFQADAYGWRFQGQDANSAITLKAQATGQQSGPPLAEKSFNCGPDQGNTNNQNNIADAKVLEFIASSNSTDIYISDRSSSVSDHEDLVVDRVMVFEKPIGYTQNLLLNGSFTAVGYSAADYWFSHNAVFKHDLLKGRGSDGTEGVNFNNGGRSAGGYTLQTINTVIGQTYTFQVDAYGWNAGNFNATSQVRLAAINGEIDLTRPYVAGWQDFTCGEDQRSTANNNVGEVFTISFTAESARTTLLILDVLGGSKDEDLVVDRAVVFERSKGVIAGTDKNETIHGSALDDTMLGGAGHDAIYGGAGNDTALYKGNFADYTITAANGVTYVEARSGNEGKDSLYNVENLQFRDGIYKFNGASFDLISNVENIVGTALDDSLTGDANANLFIAGDGNDSISGLGGDDAIYAGAGNDMVRGGLGNDILQAGAGKDFIDAGDGDDYIYQDLEKAVSDTIYGGEGIDYVDYSWTDLNIPNLISNADFDLNLTAADTDYVLDANESDLAVGHVSLHKKLKDWTSPPGVNGDNDQFLLVDGATVAGKLFWKQNVNLIGGQQYRFSYMVRAGETNPPVIQLMVGNEKKGTTTTASSGNWTKVEVTFTATASGQVQLGLKNNTTESWGNDLLLDKLNLVMASREGIVADLSSDVNGNPATVKKFNNANSIDQLYGVENLIGSSLNDAIAGNAKDNVLAGGAGADSISGGLGNDILSGGLGQDIVIAGDGDDYIYQDLQAGVSDSIVGGEGVDTVNYNVTDFSRNLINNADFDSNLTAADTEYVLDANESDLAVGHVSLHKKIAAWPKPPGINGPNDQFLLVDGAREAGKLFWKQNVNLIGGQQYRFSYMVIAGPINPPVIQLMVGGTLQGTQTTATGAWTKVEITFIAASTGQVQLGLRNDTLTEDGNNLLIDKLNLVMASQDGIFADLSSNVNGNPAMVTKLGDTNSIDHLYDIENLIGSSLNDAIAGNAKDNVLAGGTGADAINGGLGNDTLSGGLGQDIVSAGGGDDYIYQDLEFGVSDLIFGGEGADTVNYSVMDFSKNLISNADFDDTLTAADTNYVIEEDNRAASALGHVSLSKAIPGRSTAPGINGANDQFLYVDGSGEGGQLFWKQNVNLIRGQDYCFSYMVSGEGANPAAIELLIAGAPQGRVRLADSAGWTKVEIQFTAKATGQVQLGLRDNTLWGGGNDFLIDKLSLVMTSGTGIKADLSSPNDEVTKFDNSTGPGPVGGFTHQQINVTTPRNLLTNGSFENDQNSWKSPSTAAFTSADGRLKGRASDGQKAVIFNTAGGKAGGYILQTIDTTKDQTYTFQVDAYGWGSGGQSSVTLAAIPGEGLGAYLPGFQAFDCGADQKATDDSNNGKVFSITFKATSARTTLLIQDTSPAVSDGEDLVVDRAVVFQKGAGYIEGTIRGDAIHGTSADDTIRGGEGNDYIGGGAGNDTALYFGKYSDYVISRVDGYTTVTDTKNNDGTDYLYDVESLQFSDGIYTGVGNDYVNNIRGGFDSISDIENIIGTSFKDNLTGNEKNNFLSGGAGEDVIVGLSGNDTLSGGLGKDTVDGGAGDDYIYQDLESGLKESIDGGEGTDAVNYSVADLNRLNLIANADFDSALTAADTDYAVSTTFATGHVGLFKTAPDGGFKSRTGFDGDKDQFLVVNGASNANQNFWKQTVKLVAGATYRFSYMVSGGNANPATIQLWVGGVQVANGARTIGVSAGWQKMEVEFTASATGTMQMGLRNANTLGAGNDFAIDKLSLVMAAGAGIEANMSNLTNGAWIVKKFGDSTDFDTIKNVESFIGTALNDHLNGDVKDNTFVGGDGKDTLSGGLGDDILSGGSGNDTITGGDGKDRLAGDSGADTVNGGSGNDHIYQDLESGVSDSINGGEGTDTVNYSVTDLTRLNLLANAGFDRSLNALDTDYVVDPNQSPIGNGGAGHVALERSAAVGLSGANDQYLRVDGSTVAGQLFWKQTVSLVAGATYRFSYMVRGGGTNPASIQLSVDGVLRGTSTTVDSPAGWKKVEVEFTAAKTELVQLGLTDTCRERIGNDFYIDQLSLTMASGAGIVADLSSPNSNGQVTVHKVAVPGYGLFQSGSPTPAGNFNNLLSNGSFENGNQGNYWRSGVASTGGGAVLFTKGTTAAGRGTDGNEAVDFNSFGTQKDGYICQTIMTEVNKTYTFQVDAYGWGAGGDSGVRLAAIPGTNLARPYLAGWQDFLCGTDQNATNNLNNSEVFSITFTATSDQTTLLILDTSPRVSDGEDLVVDRAVVFERSKGYIEGTSRNDTIHGTSADDRIKSSAGDDYLDGGAGTDTVIYAGSYAQYTISTDQGVITVKDKLGRDGTDYLGSVEKLQFTDGIYNLKGAFNAVDQLSNVENLIGTTLNDNLTGDANDNSLMGGEGKDTLIGGLGNDLLSGGAGADSISGGGGDDYIYQDMESGATDKIHGGEGTDTVDYSVADLNCLNLIANADFDSALTAADTDYAVSTTFATGHVGLFKTAPDGGFKSRTGVDGDKDQFLVVNGASNANQIFWKQTVKLVAGATYRFSYMVSGGNANPATIQLWVGGVQVANGARTIGVSAGWQKMEVEFTATTTGTSQIGLRNANTLGAGNDFLIDKMSLVNMTGIEANMSNLTNGAFSVRKFGDPNSTDFLSNIERMVGSSGHDRLTGDARDNVLTGAAGDDVLYGRQGDDYLQGSDGNDSLYGEEGNDTLMGGAGADNLFGGGGNDVFAQTMELNVSDTMNGGDGSDTVNYSLSMLTGRYVMIRREDNSTMNVSTSAFSVKSAGKDVAATTQTAADQSWVQLDLGEAMSIDGIYATFNSLPGNYKVYVCDADMRALTTEQITARSDVAISNQPPNALALNLQAGGIELDLTLGTVQKNYSGFTTSNDAISNIENVVGTDYNDILKGNAQANALKGGAGNDALMGEAGNDVYWFGRGSGQDILIENDVTENNRDILFFEKDISNQQLWFSTQDENLHINIIGTHDVAVVNNWNNPASQIEEFRSSNNKVLQVANISTLIQAMAVWDVPISEAAFSDAKYDGVRNQMNALWQ